MGNRLFHGAAQTFGGAIDLTGGVQMKVGTYAGGGVTGDTYDDTANLAVQTANIQAQRPLQQFFDLFSRNVYYVIGRVQAQCSMDRILGPKGSMQKLYRQLSDPCLIDRNAVLLEMKGMFCAPGQVNVSSPGDYAGLTGALDVLTGGNEIILNNCAMDRVGIAMRAQDFVFMEQFSFNATDVFTGSGGGGGGGNEGE